MKNRSTRTIALGCVLLTLSVLPALADDLQAPPAAAAPAPVAAVPRVSMSLQEMLTKAKKPDQGTLFCLDAAHTLPVDPDHPEDALKAGAQAYTGGPAAGDPGPFTLRDAQSNYDRMIQHVGDLAVLAPAHMVVLNTDLGKPDLYEGLQNFEAMKMLLATLSKEQWTALESTDGLAASDMDANQQHLMLHVLGGHGRVTIEPGYVPDQPHAAKRPERDITSELSALHIRVKRKVQIYLPIGNNSYTSYTGENKLDSKSVPYYVSYMPNDALQGQSVRTVVPNAPKYNAVVYTDSRWDAAVSITNGITLGRLVAAIAQATHTELYCDKRIEPLVITAVSASPMNLRAGDLLQAAALCVAGTYRNVGPAYVLTNDMVGTGTRARLLYDYNASAAKASHALLEEASDKITPAHSLWEVPLDGDKQLDITAQQLQDARAQHQIPELDGQYSIGIPFTKMTPAQQAEARADLDYAKAHPRHGGPDSGAQPTLTGSLDIHMEPVVDLTLPDVDRPIALSFAEADTLFAPSHKAAKAIWDATFPQAEYHPPAPEVLKDVHLAAVMSSIPVRALLVPVTSLDALPGFMQNMQRAGFNQLWIDVFSGGTAHLMLPDKHKRSVNVLQAAVKLGRANHIGIVACADLYDWGQNTTHELADLTITGKTSSEYEALVNAQLPADRAVAASEAPPTTLADPQNPTVVARLTALHKQLNRVTGLAGLAWVHAQPSPDIASVLGYSVPSRLLFLRKDHIDPVDYVVDWPQVDMSLPYFASSDFHEQFKLQNDWRTFQSEEHVLALAKLRAALVVAPDVAHPLFVAEPHEPPKQGNWFGTWDSPTAPLPCMHNSWDTSLTGEPQAHYPDDPFKQAKTESRAALFTYPLVGESADAPMLALFIKQVFADSKWDGLVLSLAPKEQRSGVDAAADAAAWVAKIADTAGASK